MKRASWINRFRPCRKTDREFGLQNSDANLIHHRYIHFNENLMKSFIGGVEPDALVSVLNKKTRTSKLRKLGDLKPGDWVGQVGSTWHYSVNEVRIFKRKLSGFRITLESGECLTVAEDTILCGQYGGSLITDRLDEILCLVNLGKFVDSDDSRRTFRIEFKAQESHTPELKKLCRHNASAWRGEFEKKFYGYSDVLRFLRQLREKAPHVRVVPGLEVSRHYNEKLYDICRAKEELSLFCPLFHTTVLYDQERQKRTPTVVAIYSPDSTVESRKVVSCKPVVTHGPWAFPVFDDYDEWKTPSQHRFSFTANGIAVFYPNEFINEWSIKQTFSKKGEPLLPPVISAEEKEPSFFSLSSVYNKLGGLVTASNPAPVSIEKDCETLFNLFRSLVEQGVSEDQIVEYLGKRILEIHRSRTKTKKVQG